MLPLFVANTWFVFTWGQQGVVECGNVVFDEG